MYHIISFQGQHKKKKKNLSFQGFGVTWELAKRVQYSRWQRGYSFVQAIILTHFDYRDLKHLNEPEN